MGVTHRTTFALLTLISSATLTADEPKLGDYVTFYQASVRLRQPPTYHEQSAFPGFGNRDTHCVVAAQKLPFPFRVEDFKQPDAVQKGSKVLTQEKVTIDLEEGLLTHVESGRPDPRHPGKQLRWDLVFGNGKDSIYVAGIYYADSPEGTSQLLRTAVLSARRDNSPPPKAGERQPFALEFSKKLKVVETVWKELVLTEDGLLPLKSAAAPIFTAGHFARRRKPADTPTEVAAKLKEGEADKEDFRIESNREIELAGLQGHELVAKGTDPRGKSSVAIYYVVLYREEELFILRGECGVERAAEFLPEFKTMVHSLKLKTAKEPSAK